MYDKFYENSEQQQKQCDSKQVSPEWIVYAVTQYGTILILKCNIFQSIKCEIDLLHDCIVQCVKNDTKFY